MGIAYDPCIWRGILNERGILLDGDIKARHFLVPMARERKRELGCECCGKQRRKRPALGGSKRGEFSSYMAAWECQDVGESRGVTSLARARYGYSRTCAAQRNACSWATLSLSTTYDSSDRQLNLTRVFTQPGSKITRRREKNARLGGIGTSVQRSI